MDGSTTAEGLDSCAELQKAKDRLDSIFAAVPAGIGLVQDRIIREVNHFSCDMLGYRPEELIGQDARILDPSIEEYERVGKTKYESISKHGKGSIETQLVRKDGKMLDILLSFVPLDPSDLSAGVTFTVLDNTGQKWSQKALAESE